MKVIITRHLMAGSGGQDVGYSAYVRRSEAPACNRRPDVNGNSHTLTLRGGFKPQNEYLRFTDAVQPWSHRAMAQGWERYEDSKRLEREAESRLLELARRIYPELEHVTEWSDLWYCGLVAHIDGVDGLSRDELHAAVNTERSISVDAFPRNCCQECGTEIATCSDAHATCPCRDGRSHEVFVTHERSLHAAGACGDYCQAVNA